MQVKIYLDVLEENAPASLVLEGHKLLRVLALLVTVLFEEMRETLECDVIASEVVGLC